MPTTNETGRQEHAAEPAFEATLRGVPESDYGPRHREDQLAIYELYVEMADRISQRRQSANSFFLAVNSALVVLVGYVAGSEPSTHTVFHVPVALAGIVLSYQWYRLVCSYRQMNTGKFKVIHAIEVALPLRPYDAEWVVLGRGEDRKLYRPFTAVEAIVPCVFMLLHAVVLVLAGLALLGVVPRDVRG